MKLSLPTKTVRRTEGTVLIALLMYISTSLVLWFFGIPSMGLFDTTNTHAGLRGNSLDQYLEYAREEAIKRQTPVTVCSSKNGLECADDNEWTNGWIVFVDSDRHHGQLNPEDQVLNAYLVQNQEPVLGIDAKYIRYLANGAIELD